MLEEQKKKMNLKFLFKAYKEKRLKVISDRMFEVDNHTVTIQIKQGRRLLTCSCCNYGRFPNESFCWHREMVIVYPILKHFDKKIKEVVSFLEINKGLKKNKLDENGIITMIKDIGI